MDTSIYTGGETWLDFQIVNTKRGVEISVSSHPDLEEFFKNISKDLTDSVEGTWYPVGPQLRTYRLPVEDQFAQLGFPGQPLISFDDDGDHKKVNISFLTLVGVSKGVRFGVETPMNLELRRELKQLIGIRVKKFCLDFLVQKTMRMTIVSSG